MTALIERYRAQPRALRWLVWFLVAAIGYFAVAEPLMELAGTLNSKADTKLARLSRSGSEAAQLSAAEADVRNGLQRFGPVELPGSPKERSDALNRKIGQILTNHGVQNHTSSVKEMPLGSTSFDEVFGQESRVERLVAELQFDASPEIVAAVLADLERTPEVAAVSRVQLRKSASTNGDKKSAPKTVKATIAAEAWQLVRKNKRS